MALTASSNSPFIFAYSNIEGEDAKPEETKVNLITENHRVIPTKRKYLDLKSITIKRNAWIGATPALVNKYVPANTIVGGVPAKVIRSIE